MVALLSCYDMKNEAIRYLVVINLGLEVMGNYFVDNQEIIELYCRAAVKSSAGVVNVDGTPYLYRLGRFHHAVS